MGKNSARDGIVFLLLFISFLALSAQGETLRSPDHHLHVEFEISKSGKFKGLPNYELKLDAQTLISKSRLSLNFQGSGPLARMKIKSRHHETGASIYTEPVGKKRFVNDAYEEYSYALEESDSLHRQIELVFRIYNDGFGLQYKFPEQKAFQDFVITDEYTDVVLANDPFIYGLPLGFNSSYEWYYRKLKLANWAWWDNLALPLLLEYPNGNYVGITEANLNDYAGMYLEKSKTEANTLETRLAPWPGQTDIKVKGKTPFVSPWRTFLVGKKMNTLMESTLVEDLNEPSMIKDTSWIRPGKVQFPWWNGYVVPNATVAHPAGLNTWTLKHYIDFCAATGTKYHSIDGFNEAWYGGSVDPYQSTDVTHAIPAIDLPEVLTYAKSHGVGTRLWLHYGGISKEIDRALETYEKWGVEGIMVDFLNRDDQLMVQSYHEILTRAAAHHLTVNFHGVFKPTGQTRTYPNLLNHEAVLGTEYNKWGEFGSTPEHEVNVAYVRMLAGPLDVHQGGFRPVAVKDYKFQWTAPNVMGTLARQLATYVIFENHLPMLADYPELYSANPGPFKFIQEVPVVWDESHMVDGIVGKYISMARRKDRDWYVGSFTDRDARDFNLNLEFLGQGNYIAEIYEDSSDYGQHPEHVTIREESVSSKSSFRILLAPAGGNAIHFRRMD